MALSAVEGVVDATGTGGAEGFVARGSRGVFLAGGDGDRIEIHDMWAETIRHRSPWSAAAAECRRVRVDTNYEGCRARCRVRDGESGRWSEGGSSDPNGGGCGEAACSSKKQEALHQSQEAWVHLSQEADGRKTQRALKKLTSSLGTATEVAVAILGCRRKERHEL